MSRGTGVAGVLAKGVGRGPPCDSVVMLAFSDHTGFWTGTNEFRLMPTDPPHAAVATADVSSQRQADSRRLPTRGPTRTTVSRRAPGPGAGRRPRQRHRPVGRLLAPEPGGEGPGGRDRRPAGAARLPVRRRLAVADHRRRDGPRGVVPPDGQRGPGVGRPLTAAPAPTRPWSRGCPGLMTGVMTGPALTRRVTDIG